MKKICILITILILTGLFLSRRYQSPVLKSLEHKQLIPQKTVAQTIFISTKIETTINEAQIKDIMIQNAGHEIKLNGTDINSVEEVAQLINDLTRQDCLEINDLVRCDTK